EPRRGAGRSAGRSWQGAASGGRGPFKTPAGPALAPASRRPRDPGLVTESERGGGSPQRAPPARPRLPQRDPSHPDCRVPAAAAASPPGPTEPSRAGRRAREPPWTISPCCRAAARLQPGGRPGRLRVRPARLAPSRRAPPPPYPYLVTGIPTHHPRVYNIHSRTVTRYPANSIVVVGGCPVCRVGVLEDCFTFLGIFLAIILFPFGFICCFALRAKMPQLLNHLKQKEQQARLSYPSSFSNVNVVYNSFI
uniref:Membrane protein BRI3 n=1 Tax=Macaca fascicularis TaxID=9541 RepID=A0A7N9D531_MACFA